MTEAEEHKIILIQLTEELKVLQEENKKLKELVERYRSMTAINL